MEIKKAIFISSNIDVEKCPQTDKPEYAFIGRSNVGKSSLINMLAGHKNLALTSSSPGKTTLINHFLVNDKWYLVDLPGYGYAKRNKTQQGKFQKIINDYILKREQMLNLFLLIDSRLEPQPIDIKFMEFLGENNVPFAIVFTKADKLGSEKTRNNIKSYLETIKEQWEEIPPYFITSSEKKIGKEEILKYISSINNKVITKK